ncbi:DUF7674 family protein [Nitrogeniibacter aestuarii]|uniref:DUF7674 family protein n=1 Tax=Nitrogeniibacter aestuarii TaxID=2815343 RepID=UPI001E2EAEAA|nr:hypothetical protein [Nitrogeniibacter aestuarii]
MENNAAFFESARAKFPELAEKVDRQHVKYWGKQPSAAEDAYCWFESVSRALNSEMQREAYISESHAFFQFVECSFLTGSAEVKKCIDVAFAENLFWQVSPQKSAPYWQVLPQVLKNLYVDFHARTPL